MTRYLPSKVKQRQVLIRICMDCGEILGIKKGGSGESHGLCDSCLRQRLEEIGEEMNAAEAMEFKNKDINWLLNIVNEKLKKMKFTPVMWFEPGPHGWTYLYLKSDVFEEATLAEEFEAHEEGEMLAYLQGFQDAMLYLSVKEVSHV